MYFQFSVIWLNYSFVRGYVRCLGLNARNAIVGRETIEALEYYRLYLKTNKSKEFT